MFDLKEYARRLYVRRTEAVFSRRARVSFGRWIPIEHECHANVAQWCAFQPNHRPVRGWLYFDYDNLLPYVHFNAHSVIQNEAGELVDITPTLASRDYPFLVDTESVHEYESLLEASVVRLEHERG